MVWLVILWGGYLTFVTRAEVKIPLSNRKPNEESIKENWKPWEADYTANLCYTKIKLTQGNRLHQSPWILVRRQKWDTLCKTIAQRMPLSFKTKDHVRLQHTLRSPYKQVFSFAKSIPNLVLTCV